MCVVIIHSNALLSTIIFTDNSYSIGVTHNYAVKWTKAAYRSVMCQHVTVVLGIGLHGHCATNGALPAPHDGQVQPLFGIAGNGGNPANPPRFGCIEQWHSWEQSVVPQKAQHGGCNGVPIILISSCAYT